MFYILHIHFVQYAFDPAGIEFNTFPTMVKHIVDAMLPEQDGEVHKLSYMKVKCIGLKCAYFTYFTYLTFCLSYGW
jgi:hypothetical protein